jgi:hypothetical protein
VVSDAVRGDVQVNERRVEALKEDANAALETALSTQGVETLRLSVEAAWRSEQDTERLRARTVRTCEEALARAQHMLQLARASQNTEELREVGLEAVRTADKDTLYAMAVQAAAQDGVDVNTRAEAAAGEAPKERWLSVATRNGHVETLRALAAAGAEINHVDNYGWTALDDSAKIGDAMVIETLLAAGAEVNHVDSLGITALFVAAEHGHVEATNALLAAGAALSHVNFGGFTALYVAAEFGRVEVMRTLLAAGAEVNDAANNGTTALMGAACNGHLEALRALLVAGAAVDQVSNDGETALDEAACNGHVEVMAALAAAGAEVDPRGATR